MTAHMLVSTEHILRRWSCSAPSLEEPSVAPHSLMKQLKLLSLIPQTCHSLVSPASSASSSGSVWGALSNQMVLGLQGTAKQKGAFLSAFARVLSAAWEACFPFAMVILPAILQQVLSDPILFATNPPS